MNSEHCKGISFPILLGESNSHSLVAGSPVSVVFLHRPSVLPSSDNRVDMVRRIFDIKYVNREYNGRLTRSVRAHGVAVQRGGNKLSFSCCWAGARHAGAVCDRPKQAR
jgi:hypothetical protein